MAWVHATAAPTNIKYMIDMMMYEHNSIRLSLFYILCAISFTLHHLDHATSDGNYLHKGYRGGTAEVQSPPTGFHGH